MAFTNERNDSIGESSGEQLLVGLDTHHFLVFKKRERWVGALFGLRVGWPHVVRVRNARELIETVTRGQKGREVPQMPLSVNGGGIPLRLAYFSECGFCARKTVLRVGPQGTMNGKSIGVASSQQGGSRSGTHGLRYAKVGESNPLGGHGVEMRGTPTLFALARKIAVAKIIAKDDDDVGRGRHQERQRQCKHGRNHKKTAASVGRGGRAKGRSKLPAKKSFFELLAEDDLIFPNTCPVPNTEKPQVDRVVVLRPSTFSRFDGNNLAKQNPLGLLGLPQDIHVAVT